jgi:hypothetical protein
MAAEGDDYERKYMSGEGEVLHRAKIKAPSRFFLFFAVPLLLQVVMLIVAALATKAVPLAVMLMPVFFIPFFGMMALLFAVLRITVSTKILHVQYGLFGPKIPIESIQSAEVVDYDWKKYGGFGIRRGRDGSWAYNMMGDAGRAVKVVWTDKGKTNTHLLVSSDPGALVSAIKEACTGAPRLRVQDDSASADALIAEAEREAEELEKRKA